MNNLYYDFREKVFYYEEAEENRITINYQKGRFTVDMSGFFPCSKHDYKIFLDMIENSNECKEHVARLQDFFSCAISILEKYRNGAQNASIKADYNTQLKKWLALYNELSRRYNLEEKTDSEATVKCKKIVCYPFCKWDNNKPVAVDGWKFEKYGMQFYVYRHSKNKLWYVIMPFCGLAISSGERSKQAAIASVNEELIERIKKVLVNPAKNEKLQQNYIAFLKKGNVDDVIQDPFYNIPAFQTKEATPEKTVDTTENTTSSNATEKPIKPETLNSDNYTEYAVKGRDGLVTPLQYNGNEGYVYAVIDGTIYSTCTYKNHADLYSMVLVPLCNETGAQETEKAAAQNGECSQAFKTGAKTVSNASGVKVYGTAIKRSKNGAQRFTGHTTPLLQAIQVIQAIQAMQPTGYTTPPRCNATYYDSS